MHVIAVALSGIGLVTVVYILIRAIASGTATIAELVGVAKWLLSAMILAYALARLHTKTRKEARNATKEILDQAATTARTAYFHNTGAKP